MTLRERLHPFHARRVTLSAPCEVAECVERLRADIVPYWTPGEPAKCMIGSVKPTRFGLHRRLHGVNGSQTEACGRLEPGGRGTMIEVKFGWSPLEIASLVYEIGAAAYVIRGMWTGHRPPAGMIALLLLPVFLPTLMSFSGRLSRAHDDDWLVARLCELLDGVEVPRALD